MEEDEGTVFLDKARHLVWCYYDGKVGSINFNYSDVRVVWFCKTLKNWKAMVAIVAPNGAFFEVTYNGDSKETYLDVYIKTDNVKVPD